MLRQTPSSHEGYCQRETRNHHLGSLVAYRVQCRETTKLDHFTSSLGLSFNFPVSMSYLGMVLRRTHPPTRCAWSLTACGRADSATAVAGPPRVLLVMVLLLCIRSSETTPAPKTAPLRERHRHRCPTHTDTRRSANPAALYPLPDGHLDPRRAHGLPRTVVGISALMVASTESEDDVRCSDMDVRRVSASRDQSTRL